MFILEYIHLHKTHIGLDFVFLWSSNFLVIGDISESKILHLYITTTLVYRALKCFNITMTTLQKTVRILEIHDKWPSIAKHSHVYIFAPTCTENAAFSTKKWYKITLYFIIYWALVGLLAIYRPLRLREVARQFAILAWHKKWLMAYTQLKGGIKRADLKRLLT
jgi:hypothetical protein